MADRDLSSLERKLAQDPGDVPLLINYLSVLRRTTSVLDLELFLTSHVNQHKLQPFTKFSQNHDQALLDLGLVPGAYTKVSTGHHTVEACIEDICRRLELHARQSLQRIGPPDFINKIDGNQVSRRPGPVDPKVEANIIRYQQHFAFTVAQLELLSVTMRIFSYLIKEGSGSKLNQYAIFFPAWALDKTFALSVTRTHKGVSRNNTWMESDSNISGRDNNNWNPSQINKMRQELVSALTAFENPSLSFISLKMNGMFDLDRWLNLYNSKV